MILSTMGMRLIRCVMSKKANFIMLPDVFLRFCLPFRHQGKSRGICILYLCFSVLG